MRNIIKALYIAGETNPDILVYEAELLSFANKDKVGSLINWFRQVPKKQEEYYNNICNKFNF